jgi:signal transduction histidine kinase
VGAQGSLEGTGSALVGRIPRRASVLAAWVGGALATVLAMATLGLAAATPSGTVEALLTGSHLVDAGIAVAFLAYSAVGALIVARRGDNRVGWIFLGAGLAFQLWVFTWRYASVGLSVWPGSLPGTTVAAWLSLWIFVPGFGLAFTFLLQVFPEGSLLSRRWRLLAWFTAVALVVWAFTWGTVPGPMAGFPDVDNPVGIAAVGRLDGGEGWVLFVLAVLASAASLVVRYVRSSGAARRQIRWLAYAAGCMGLALVVVTLGSEGVRAAEVAGEVLFPLAIAAVPIAAFVAIFKHDLYDLDVVVSKTLTFGVLVALITVAYVGAVAGIGAAAGAAGELSLTLAVVVTAVVAVAFQPVRTRVARLANRLVYGAQATPYEVLAGFSRRLGATIDAQDALAQMARIVGEGVGATVAEVWLVMDASLRRAAAWPSDPRPLVIALADGGLPALSHADRTVQVRDRGALLGAISLSLPPGRVLTPTEDRLLGDLASQAGLVLSNVRLIEQLKASQQRLVAAQDEERRRIERDIHDGVQQRVVTLALTLRMLAARLGTEAQQPLDEGLDAAAREANETLAELRRLARGIHPAIVTEGGMEAALESLAERSPVPVELRMAEVGELPSPVEVSVYYLVAEALTNVAKHAEAATATVTVARQGSQVGVEVCDDGVGGATPALGSGLAGLADRIAALGGRLDLDSPPRGGTRLRAEIPCGS